MTDVHQSLYKYINFSLYSIIYILTILYIVPTNVFYACMYVSVNQIRNGLAYVLDSWMNVASEVRVRQLLFLADP